VSAATVEPEAFAVLLLHDAVVSNHMFVPVLLAGRRNNTGRAGGPCDRNTTWANKGTNFIWAWASTHFESRSLELSLKQVLAAPLLLFGWRMMLLVHLTPWITAAAIPVKRSLIAG
jgi:hypothetical protein